MDKKELLKKARDAYEAGNPIMSDDAYDLLADEVKEETVGSSDLSEDFEKFTHKVPLGSLDKENTFEGFQKWSKKNSGDKVIQLKLDGISIGMNYKNGKLVAAATRGTGTVGEDITRNVVKMKGVKPTVPYKDDIEIRGEILFKHADFEASRDQTGYKNPRNAASGIAKRKNGEKSEMLSVMVYDVMRPWDHGLTTEVECLKKLEDFGFEVVPYELVSSDDEAKTAYDLFLKKRPNLGFEVDGTVVKVNEIASDDEWQRPKTKIAWKFPHQRKQTTIKAIAWQCSGNHITPVATFEPIEIQGVTITRASLGNARLVQNYNIGVGALVEVSRRNDVIPHVDSVLIPGQPPQIITECPICGSPVEFEKNDNGVESAFLVCTNEECDSKTFRQIMAWLRVHDCKGVGKEIINDMLDSGIIGNLVDLIAMQYSEDVVDKVRRLPGIGEKKVSLLLKEIRRTSETDLIRFMTAMNIPGIGQTSMESITAAMEEENLDLSLIEFLKFVKSPSIKKIPGLGQEKIKSLIGGIASKADTIKGLQRMVTINVPKKVIVSDKLKDQSFCFTGPLESMSRDLAEIKVKSHGGKISGVNKNLTYLVCNDTGSSSGKMKKARDLNVTVIPETVFLKLIGEEHLIEQKESTNEEDSVLDL